MTLKPAVIEKRLNSLQNYLRELRAVPPESLATLSADVLRWNGILHLLQLCVEHVVDIGNLLLASRAVISDDSRETIINLGRHGLLPVEFTERIAPMTGFRNVIVHEYMTVDPKIVYEVLRYGLDDFEQFAVYVYDHLRRENLF